VAEDKLQRLDTGGTAALKPVVEPTRQTVQQHVNTFITAKRDEGCSEGTIRKLEFQLGKLERFLSARSPVATGIPEYAATGPHSGNRSAAR